MEKFRHKRRQRAQLLTQFRAFQLGPGNSVLEEEPTSSHQFVHLLHVQVQDFMVSEQKGLARL